MSSRGWEKRKAREQEHPEHPSKEGLEPPNSAWRRAWGDGTGGGHFYLVTKESHTIVLFSALERVGACIYQRD